MGEAALTMDRPEPELVPRPLSLRLRWTDPGALPTGHVAVLHVRHSWRVVGARIGMEELPLMDLEGDLALDLGCVR